MLYNYHLWKIVVTKMQQYQCVEKVLKFPIETSQINFEHSDTFSSEEHQSTNMPVTYIEN